MNGRETFALKSALSETNDVSEVWGLFKKILAVADDYFLRVWGHEVDRREDRYGRPYCATCQKLDPAEGWKQSDICSEAFKHGEHYEQWHGTA